MGKAAAVVPDTDNVWGQEAPPALGGVAQGWASDEDAPRALAADTAWASQEEPPSGLMLPDAVAGWSAADDVPRVLEPEPQARRTEGSPAATSADGAWGEDAPAALGAAVAGWGSGDDAPRALAADTAWTSQEEPPAGLTLPDPVAGWSAADDVPRVLAPEREAGQGGGTAPTTSAQGAWGEDDAPPALNGAATGWAADEDAPRVLASDSGWTSQEEPPSGLTAPAPVAGWSAADDVPRVLAPDQRSQPGPAHPTRPGQDISADARTEAQTIDQAVTRAPRTATRSPRSTDRPAGDADARGDPDTPAFHPAGSTGQDSSSERESPTRQPAPPASTTPDSPTPDNEAARPDTSTHQETNHGGNHDPNNTADELQPYATYDEVVTPNGAGYVVAQSEDGVLVNEGGTYQLYSAERLSRPGQARPPEPVDTDGEERRARKLAAAISPEGLELRGDNARLARLNLEEGHGQVLDDDGVLIGWIRRRGRTWYGQDARGGIRSSTSWAETKSSGPIRAAELMAGGVAYGSHRDRTMNGGEPFRHIRPDEVTAPIFYSALTEAQTRELRTLAEQWKTAADPDLRTAAEQWSQEVTTAQMRRLATAVEEVAAHADTTTPEGRRRQGVLERLAANVRSQAHAAEGAFSTLPPPGEPDPWARAYRPQEHQQTTATEEEFTLPSAETQDGKTAGEGPIAREGTDAPPLAAAAAAPETAPRMPAALPVPEDTAPSPVPVPSPARSLPGGPNREPAGTTASAPPTPQVAEESAPPDLAIPASPVPATVTEEHRQQETPAQSEVSTPAGRGAPHSPEAAAAAEIPDTPPPGPRVVAPAASAEPGPGANTSPDTQHTAAGATPTPQDAGTGFSPDSPQEQGELFTVAVPTATAAATEPDPQSGAAHPSGPAEEQPPFPKLTQAASRALFDIARGDITEVDGVFMKQTPTRGTTAKAPSQKAVNDILDAGLAERMGQHIALSERGTAWFTHHNIKLPATGLRDTSALDPALLPPVDYRPLNYLPVADEQPERLSPPAPAALPANWHSRAHAATEAQVQATKDKAVAAGVRAAQSTARDLEELAAGPGSDNRWVWRSQFPLAQYDENAAAALEHLTDPAARAYAIQAVHQLRAAIEAVGRTATADYVQRIRGAGTDPMAMDKVWRTSAGIQADDTYRHRVRGIVITYLEAIGEHADEIGLDWQAIVTTLEDAAGWTGGMQPLTLRHQYEHAYFPDAEEVAEAAGFVARALHEYVLGESGAVDAWAHLRDTWRPIEPRPTSPEPVATGNPAASVETPPAQAAPTAPAPVPRAPIEETSETSEAAQDERVPQPADSAASAPQPTPAQEQATPIPPGTEQMTTVGEAQPAVAPTRPNNSNTAQQPDNRPTAAALDGPEPVQADPTPAVDLKSGDAPSPAKPTTGPGTSPADAAPKRRSEPTSQAAPPQEEGSVEGSGPPADNPEEPPGPASPNVPLDAPAVQPYASPDAYASAHAALLRELAAQEPWLAQSPAAAAAAATVKTATTLSLPTLTTLLTLQDAAGHGADVPAPPPRLAQLLGHHIQCTQITLAARILGQAARSTTTEHLRELHSKAIQGQFIAHVLPTADGEMELGQYLVHRNAQITQQPHPAEGPLDEEPATGEETTPMAVDPDDDFDLPVLELAGEVHMTAQEAAPHLLAHAQRHMADGQPSVEAFAHLHGQPVFAMVQQGEPPVLYFGLTREDTDGDARAVSIRRDELATVPEETLLTAVTGWLNAPDTGRRPLLDYAPNTTSAPTAGPSATAAPVPSPTEPVPAMAAPSQPTAVNDTVPEPSTLQAADPGGPQEQPEPLPAPATAPTTTTPDPIPPAATEVEATPEQVADAPAPATQAPEAGERVRAEDSRQETVARPAAAPTGEAQADPVVQITELVRTALADSGNTLNATGVLTAPGTIVITLETSGTAEGDRTLAATVRAALNTAIRQHSNPELGTYRVDFEHTAQVGQGTFQAAPGLTAAPVPRERLIAANRAAAQILADHLQSDPNAHLARTYLTEERQLPPEVQQEWGLGYAPSDRDAGRWDVLVRALRDQGFTDEELLQAGLATRSRRDTLIDRFRDRIMFAIHDEHGDIVGFSGRRIDRPGETEDQAKDRGGPKYFNTASDAALFTKGDLVFGLHHPAQAPALAQSSGPRVSVEGFLDVIAVARAAATVPIEQRPTVGAPMGTAFTERQLTVLRGLDTDNPRPHIAFLDADESGRKVLLDKWDLLVKAAGPTSVTTAPDAKDAAKLWEEGIEADGDGATPVLRALEQRQPLLDAAVEAVLWKNADDTERTNHAFDSAKFFPRTRFIAAEAARYIHQAVQAQTPGDTAALEQAALTWAKRLDQEWSIPGHMTATAVLLGPGNHHEDYENEVYEQALDLLAADPDGHFANDSHVRSRQSASQAPSAEAPTAPDQAVAETARPGQWPAGTGTNRSTSGPPGREQVPDDGALALSMFLPSPVDPHERPPVEHTDRTTAAYALHAAVHERLGQHTAESPEPDRLPHPLKLGTIYGVDLSTSGDDQTSDDPTVVVWLGTARTDSLRMSYSRLVKMTGPELLAAIEWRAAQAAGLLGAPLSQSWRTAVRNILPPQFPAQPTPAQLADLLDTIDQGPDGNNNQTRRRAEQALALYTAGHPDLALNRLAADDHIWVLRNDGSWIQEEAVDTEQSWEELEAGFVQEAAEVQDITQAAAELPPVDGLPMAADLTVAHHSAHEALAALRPYSIGLPGTVYEKITDLVAQMDAGEPAMRRLHGPGGEQLMNRAKRSFVRILEGLATVASKIRLTGLSNRLERTVARLRGQDLDTQPTPRAVRTDRRMQDLAHIERDLERRMAAPTTALGERGELQEQWIINRARWRARYEQLNGQPPGGDFLPDNGLVAGAPPVPNLIDAHGLLVERLTERVAELRDTDPHTGEDADPYEPTADLLNGVAWAYQQRLVGIVPTGDDPQGPLPTAQVRQAALMVTAHQNASPLTLRRTMNVSAERADRLLHRLEEKQILGPYRADAPRTVLARTTDIDALLARSATPPGPRTSPAAPGPAPRTKNPAPKSADATGAEADERDTARIRELVDKILADKQTRSATGGVPEPADGAAPASRVRKNLRKSTRTEAEDNALAAGQPTSLAPSQS
ncbi:toprim domain-containing protein [Streptomyces sp. NPDC051546]|uniref:toprim domain-containing protein n=1 Tax=Streptomyces sp. NPDC051546 TaxID=3365655 RepID=UPI0037BC1392